MTTSYFISEIVPCPGDASVAVCVFVGPDFRHVESQFFAGINHYAEACDFASKQRRIARKEGFVIPK